MSRFDIVTMGEILIDYTSMGSSKGGQRIFAQNAGGAPANVAVCGAKLGRQCAFIGKVGNDMQGKFLIDTLSSCGVDTSGMRVDTQYFTTLAFVDIDSNGERTFSFARNHGADTQLRIEEVDNDILTSCKVFHVGSLSLTTPLGVDTTMHALSVAKQAGAIISYDPNYRASLWNSEQDAIGGMKSILPFADVVKVSDQECSLLAGTNNEVDTAHSIAEQGAHIVCVTLGSNGAYVLVGDKGQYVPGFTADTVVDTTGAGDSFWGAMLSAIATIDKPLADITLSDIVPAVQYANATASLCIERSGAIPAMPTVEQIEARLLTK